MKAASASVETVFSGVGNLARKSPTLSADILSDYAICHYNYDYDWLRPSSAEIISAYTTLHGKELHESDAEELSDSSSSSSEEDDNDGDDGGDGGGGTSTATATPAAATSATPTTPTPFPALAPAPAPARTSASSVSPTDAAAAAAASEAAAREAQRQQVMVEAEEDDASWREDMNERIRQDQQEQLEVAAGDAASVLLGMGSSSH